MIISSHFIQFHNFVILLLRYSKFFSRISDFQISEILDSLCESDGKKTIKSILQLSSIYTSDKANDIVAAEGYFILDRKFSIKL
jgi:hypothetical protein